MENCGTSMLCEQGDMGLWNTPVSRQDQQQQLDESATSGGKKNEDADK